MDNKKEYFYSIKERTERVVRTICERARLNHVVRKAIEMYINSTTEE